MTHSQNRTAARTRQAAMFIDYDNLYTILKSQSGADRSTTEYAKEIFDEVRRYLEEGDDTPTIFARAYGAFGTRVDDDSQAPSILHRQGIDPVHVPAAMQNNTSEIRLTLDVTQFLERRPDVQTVVVVTGNRPYLPLVRWIREQGCRPLVAAVNPPQTADTPSFEEDSQYLDARNLLSQGSREELLANAPESGAAYTRATTPDNPPPQQFQDVTNPVARRAIEITEEYFGQYDEVYLTPLLRKLSDVLGSDHDPKSLVSDLEAAGAARLEKRNGYPYNYTVLIVNDEHPDVKEVHEELAPESTSDATAAANGSQNEAASASEDDSPEQDVATLPEDRTEEPLSSSPSPTDTVRPAENGNESASLDADADEES